MGGGSQNGNRNLVKMDWPATPTDYRATPWTDPNGIQWIYDATIPAWARYRVASTGGVSSFNDLTDVPAAITAQQDAATASIRKIGTGATDAAAGDHSHADLTNATFDSTPNTIPKRNENGDVEHSTIFVRAITIRNLEDFTGSTTANNLTGTQTYQEPNASGVKALTADTQGRPDALFNATISGTLTVNSTSFTFGTGAAVAFFAALVDGNESTARTELGMTTVGSALAVAATPMEARSTLEEKLYIDDNDAVARSSNNTISDDDVLKNIPLDANSVYEISAMVVMSCLGVPGWKFRLKLSDAASLVSSTYFGTNLFGGGPQQYLITASNGYGVTITRSAAASLYGYHICIQVSTAAAVNLSLQWAQNTSAALPEFAQRKAGSWIKTKKLN